MLKRLAHQVKQRLMPQREPQDARGRRLVAVIDCMLNQNARDAGAASFEAMSWDVLSLCREHGVGVLQMPCPEIACLGHARARPPGQSIRQALDTASGRQGCARLGAEMADRLQAYVNAGCRVEAVLGGNPQSPGCAVHHGDQALAAESGIFMLALQAELRGRGLEIPFHGMRDADPQLFAQDLQWLRGVLEVPR